MEISDDPSVVISKWGKDYPFIPFVALVNSQELKSQTAVKEMPLKTVPQEAVPAQLRLEGQLPCELRVSRIFLVQQDNFPVVN